ncbi:M56 family metallopeptidase [Agromyces aurantiacus]|uniref:M56 family metallopeptidase n=1 Tax=Agromyces aurantiacus TaxID=165814 RepID=A0ABV9R9J6_9MICO|nr:M56 family metallopeptidase [Agromyces aurantiacus]MBM7504621.1 Zn-dependent protease with chaperone function [Agromyces aurantiacus]
MIAAAVALGALAAALAWPVPVALSTAGWPSRSPATALALWQGIALGGALAMIGALLAFGASPAGSLAGAVRALLPAFAAGPIPESFGVVHLAALTLAVGLTVHLALNVGTTAVRAERSRRRLHRMVDLLADPTDDDSGARVLAHPIPLAYCVPGLRTATVITEGLVDLLDADELRAVIAHERAHLDQFHHLVLLAFRAWHQALPWFPIANRAERAVVLLTEMLADDRARREVGAEPLRAALVRVGAAGEPGPYADTGGVNPDAGMLEQRLERLGPSRHPLDPRARAACWAATAGIVAVPVGVLAGIAF